MQKKFTTLRYNITMKYFYFHTKIFSFSLFAHLFYIRLNKDLIIYLYFIYHIYKHIYISNTHPVVVVVAAIVVCGTITHATKVNQY